MAPAARWSFSQARYGRRGIPIDAVKTCIKRPGESPTKVTYYTGQRGPNTVSSSYAEYQFKTADGKEMSGHQNSYYVRVDQEVKIEYLPDSPDWNRFAGAGHVNEHWNLPMVIGGLLFFVLGIYAFVQAYRHRRASTPSST
jgi:hypothetical protein